MRGFDFGINWQAFSEYRVDDDRFELVSRSLQSLLQRDSFQGLHFLDVGCGSGLFTLAAGRLGALALGIDINSGCIAISEQNRDRFAPGSSASFQRISALDIQSLLELGQFDVVYAWGSLHHTGEMWNAIQNTSQLVAPGGTFVLAIYNQHFTSPAWKGIKWLYNRLPRLLQRLMALFFGALIYLAKFLVTRRDPLQKERGMDFWYDVIDWIGGYPYEYARPEDVVAFVTKLGFQFRRLIPAQVPTGCNEFVFDRVT